jgi:hypothetical protein
VVAVAVWLDGAIHFATGATEQKALNLTGNPHAVLTTGCNTWDARLDVVVEGDAVQVTDDHILNRTRRRGPPSGTDDGSTRPAAAASTTPASRPYSRSSPPRSWHSERAPSRKHVTGSDPPEADAVPWRRPPESE